MHRLLCLAMGVAFVAVPGLADPGPEPQLVVGVRQVQDGDLESAVATLQALIERLRPQADRRPELARAYLYLGIAHVGLNDTEAARARFRDALSLDSHLKLGASDFPPKVITLFDAARREAPPASLATHKSGSAAPLILIGVVGAGAGTAAVLAGGGDAKAEGVVRFSDARFSTPSMVCNNGARDASLPVAILINATNSRAETVLVQSVSASLTIVASPAFPEEVGMVSQRGAIVTPAALDPNSTVTLRVDTTLGCTNDFGNESRYNDWSAEVSLVAAAKIATVRTADRVRVDNP